MSSPGGLELLSEARLDPSPHGGRVLYNPTMELFAAPAGHKTLQVWRAEGQVVAKIRQRGESDTVEALQWKADGQFLAVGWSDGAVRLMGLENTKAVHQIPVSSAGKSKITCIGWSRNDTGRVSSATAADPQNPWEVLSSLGFDGQEKKTPVDLPRELIFLEVETALPKISPLPVSGGSGDDVFVFTTRASMEFLFRPFLPEDSEKVDVMIVGTDDGHITLSIYDSFVIGSFQYQLPKASGSGPTLQLAAHASHPHLTFIRSSPENLSLLASKTTTLQNLLRYIKQVQMHMAHEWQSTRELPGRFLSSINATLAEAGTYRKMGIEQALYHSVVTGHTFPEIKEWLVDQLAERGHKRWDKAVVSGLESLRGLVHENFLPVLDRIAIILSRLLGIARFHESRDEIGFTAAQITKVMDIVSCLMLVGNKVLLLVMEELELFHSFSGWMRFEIDRLASSSTNEDISEKETVMDHGKILAYIQNYMLSSSLGLYLSNVARDSREKDAVLADDDPSLLETLDKQIRNQEAGQLQPTVFPQIEFLCGYLAAKSSAVFDGLAEAEKRSVRFGQPVELNLGGRVSKLDVRVCASEDEGGGQKSLTYTAMALDGQESNIYVFRTAISIVNGISGAVATQASSMTLGNGRVLDLKFFHHNHLLVLWALPDQTIRILRIPHTAAGMGYRDYRPGGAVEPQVLSSGQTTGLFRSVEVPCAAAFRPARVEVKEASHERGPVPARVCLLGDDAQTYRVFALPDDFAEGAPDKGAGAVSR